MILTKAPVHLLDVNVVIALLDQAHIHNQAVEEWFDTPGLQWALCAFTEAGVLRFFTRPKTGDMNMEQVTAMLERLKQEPGYRYQPIPADWQTLTKPFFKRLHGHNQITDAYLLGLAVREGLVFVTFDRAILHLAGEHSQHVHIVGPK
jgi:hypothetical protein